MIAVDDDAENFIIISPPGANGRLSPQRYAEGADLLDGAAVLLGAEERVPSPKVKAVDTTWAGDAFTGSPALRLADGDDLATAARMAVRVASFTTTRPGAQRSHPTPAEFAVL